MNAPEKIALSPKAQFLAENRKAGEEYAGIVLGKNGEKDYHLFLLPGEATSVTHKEAVAWAKKAGGDLPTRREQSLLFANLKEHFQQAWYWSGEKHVSGSDCAWVQYFDFGDQHYSSTYGHYRARAVRRLEIQ